MSFAGKVKAGEAYVRITADNSALLRGLSAAQNGLRSFGQNLKGIGGDMMMLGGALSVPLVMAGKSFADFDDKMRALQAVSGASGSEMTHLNDVIRNLGATTAFTAHQVAQGGVNLARMGFDASEVEDGLKPVMDLVRATGTDVHRLGEISEYAASTLKQFGISSSQFSRVCDVMAYASNKSSMTIADMGEAMKIAGPSAKTLGENVEDTAAMLMQMANAGIKGSLAGTSLRKLYQSLAVQSGKTSGLSKAQIEEGVRGNQQLREMGIQVIDPETGNLRSAIDIMADIAKKAKAMKNGEKINFTTDVFDLRGSLAALAMLNDAFSSKEFRKKLGDVQGYASKTAAKIEEGFGGMIRYLISQFQEMQISIGEAFYQTFEPWIKKIPIATKIVLNFLNANKKLVAYFATGIVSLFAFGAAIFAAGVACKILSSILGVLIFAIKTVAFVVLLPVNMFKMLVAAIHLVKTACLALETAFFAIKAGLMSISLMQYIALFASLGAIVAVIVLTFDSLKATISNIGKMFSNAFGRIKSIAFEAFGIVKDALLAGDTAGAAKVGLSALYVAWLEGVAPIKKLWAQLKNFLSDTWTITVFGILKLGNNLWYGLLMGLKQIGDAMMDAWSFIWDSIVTAFEKTILELQKLWIRTKGMFDSEEEVNAEIEIVEREYNDRKAAREQRSDDAVNRRAMEREELNNEWDRSNQSIDDAKNEEIQKNRNDFNDSQRESAEKIANAKKEYEAAKEFAKRYQDMKKIVQKITEMFNESQEIYRENDFEYDEDAKSQIAKFQEMQKSDPNKADEAIREAIKQEKEKVRAAKEAFNDALKEAQEDRVIDSNEERNLGELSAAYGRASELKAQYEALLNQSSGTVANEIAMSAGGGAAGIFGGKDVDALGIKSPIQKIDTNMEKIIDSVKKIVTEIKDLQIQYSA